MKIFLALVAGVFVSSLAYGKLCEIMSVGQYVNDVYQVYDYGPSDKLKVESEIELSGGAIGNLGGEEYNYGFHWSFNGAYSFSHWWNVIVDEGEYLPLSTWWEITVSSSDTPSSVTGEAFIDRIGGPGDVEESVSWLRSH